MVGAQSFRKVVKKTDQGEQFIPLVASQTKRARPAPPIRAKPEPPVTSKVLQNKLGIAARFSEVLDLVKTIWTVVKPLEEPLSRDHPVFAQRIAILMSYAVLNSI